MISDLQRHLRPVRVPSGKRVLHTDDWSTEMYFVDSGGPINVLGGAHGEAVNSIEAGQCFGEGNVSAQHLSCLGV